ncbi:hypothetical protein VP01_510g11 [Puccinia sorghi]|uniref:Uncharacterized protein n=1 Tax=Puccinia sorghi TaxID=27349 RepID=A0A0L6UL76_9BASI|nr:hypothetical protein VP01_510g11 [Puccinia sorghi]
MQTCKCSVCIKFQYLDDTGQRQQGRYLSARIITQHRFDDYQRAISIPTFSHNDDTLSDSLESPSTTESELSSIIEHQNPLGQNCKTAIRMIINILQVATKHPNTPQVLRTIPRDPRTLIKRAQLDVTLTEKICCQICFCLYEFEPSDLWLCTYKRFNNSDPCGEELFVKRKIYRGHRDVGDLAYYTKPPKVSANAVATPRCVFLSQPILTWLTWLLSKPETEKAMEEWIQFNQDLKDQGYTSDVQHGQNFVNTDWKKETDMLQIVLSLFVDWFNPRGNKISGKVASTGLLAISCLNLPPSVRNKLSHMCIAGITPGPYSPDPQTFNHLLGPLVDELIILDAGITIPTYQFPNGRFVQAKLLAVYGDILATKKVVGFASHSATKFCTFCHATQAELPSLRLSARREKEETITAARNSLAAMSAQAQSEILKATGVRWSELNRLAYWDPSRHVVLGAMHNWLEGILQGHFRVRWRFGSVSPKESKKKRRTVPQSTSGPNKRARIPIQSTMEIDSEDEVWLSETDSDEDILLNSGEGCSFFTGDDVDQFRSLMKQVILPPGVPHLPHNLGEASHGKLSASQWHALFVFIIPIVIPQMYVDQPGKVEVNSNRYKFLVNTAHLVQCTNVVFARKFKAGDLKRFEMHYTKYSNSVSDLFEDVKIQPNHHFALHIPQQMAAWGPLSGVAEFPGERLIGFLQKISTNNKITEMHRSMMTRGCRLQRLMDDAEYTQLKEGQDKDNRGTRQQPCSIRLLSSRYDLLLRLVEEEDQSVVHRDTFPVPRRRWALCGDVLPIRSINCNGLMVGSMAPRDCVVVQRGGKMKYGLVRQCYRYSGRSRAEGEFLVMSTITNLYPKVTKKIPSRPFRYLLFLYGMVVGRVEDTEEAVWPSEVTSLASYQHLAHNTFSIPSNGIALIPHGYDAFLNISGHE